MENITTLLNQIGEITKRHEEIAKLSGENFNVFKVIGVTTDEVRLHSRFIAELLNPNGSHGQGDAFLSLFVSEVNKNKELNIENFDTKTANVFVEKNIGEINKDKTEGGQIDIIITDKLGKHIIIENKIYAPDQDKQLLRYSNYNKDNLVALFYLTLDGKDPQPKSYGDLKKNKKFYCISYKIDILNWLIECRKEAVLKPLLREGISHYINVIKFLTGQSINQKMDKAMSDEIVKKILETPNTLKGALSVEKNIIEAKTKIQWEFWDVLQKKLKDKGYSFEKITEEMVKNYYKCLKTYECDKHKCNITLKIEIKKEISLFFEIQILSYVYFGIKRTNDEVIDKKIKEIFVKKYNESNEAWLVWKAPKPENIVYFCDFTNKKFNFTNSESVKNKAIEIAKEAINDIEKFKEALNKLDN